MDLLISRAAAPQRPHRCGDHPDLLSSPGWGGRPDAARSAEAVRRRSAEASQFTYWSGTNLLGRDTFSRLMLGISESFIVAFASVAVAANRRTIIGPFAAWWGHLWDGAMRTMDVLLAFPQSSWRC